MKNSLLAAVIITVLALSVASTVFAISGGLTSLFSPGNATGKTVSTTSQTGVAILNKAQSGLVASDSLNNNQVQQQLESAGGYWSYGGSTNSTADYNFYESANQLNIGVAASKSGEWSGFYAVTQSTNASLVNAVLTTSAPRVSAFADTGLYMKATNQLINYLACIAITTPSGVAWGVVHAFGESLQSATIVPLWVDASPNQPLTRDCQLVTDGTGSVTVFLDHQVVFSTTSASLGMPGPYNFFVEEESAYAGHILYGGYQDFYATLGDTVNVTGIPAGAMSVAIVNQSGSVLARSSVTGSTAVLPVGQYGYPLSGYVRVYGAATGSSNATMIATTPLEAIYGGDVYTFDSITQRTLTLSVQARDTGGHDLNGIYFTITQAGTELANTTTPWTFQLNSSETYTITAYDYGQYIFDHWSSGSTSRVLTISLTQNTALTAVYRSVNAAPPIGDTAVTISAVTSSGAPLTGFFVTVWESGFLKAVSYTPAHFDLTTGAAYIIAPASYGNYTFSHWSDGSTEIYYSMLPFGQTETLVAVYDYTG